MTLNDRRTTRQMAAAQAALAGCTVTWVLGGHPLEILDTTDVLCLSGGVPLDNPLVVEAVRRHPLTNDTQSSWSRPLPTIGITGSAGKTTTTSLVGRMAKEALRQPGSMSAATSAIRCSNYVDEMQPDDLAILEISSFQLEQMTISPRWRPS